MADRIIKPDSGNDVVIQNNDGTRKIEVTNSGDVEVTGDLKATTVKATNLKANDGTQAITISDSSGSVGVTLGTDAGDDFNVDSGKLIVKGDSGRVGIGQTSPSGNNLLTINGPSYQHLQLQVSGTDTGYFATDGSNMYIGHAFGVIVRTGGGSSVNGTDRMTINSSGVTVSHLNKSSGTFKIDHPLKNKSDTHHLVHSFIEGPQADLIYRGKVTLVKGEATVNLCCPKYQQTMLHKQ